MKKDLRPRIETDEYIGEFESPDFPKAYAYRNGSCRLAREKQPTFTYRICSGLASGRYLVR